MLRLASTALRPHRSPHCLRCFCASPSSQSSSSPPSSFKIPARDADRDRSLSFTGHVSSTLQSYRELAPFLSPNTPLMPTVASSGGYYLLKEHCPAFDLPEFLEGAEGAFYAIFQSFYARDWDALRSMSTAHMADAMEKSIDDFDALGHTWKIPEESPSGFELVSTPRVVDIQLHGAAIAHALFCNAEIEAACPGFTSRKRLERGVMIRVEFEARETIELQDADGEAVAQPSSRSRVQTLALQFAGKLRMCGRERYDAPPLGDFEKGALRRAASASKQHRDRDGNEYDDAEGGQCYAWLSGTAANAEEGDERWDLAASFTSFEGDHDEALEERLPQDFDWVVTTVEY